jgi:hypothetical protein
MIIGTTDNIEPGSGWITSIDAKYLPAQMFKPRDIVMASNQECSGEIPKPPPTPSVLQTPTTKPPAKPPSREQFGGGVCPELKALIASGEGGYDSINRGRGGDTKTRSPEYYMSTDNRDLTQMTVGEILQKNDLRKQTAARSGKTIPGTILAAGKYQLIGDTIRQAVSALNIPLTEVYNKTTQEKLGEYLIIQKRKKVGDYLKCSSGVSINDAMLALAQEFASFPDPTTGKGYYSGQRAAHSVETVKAVLTNCRSKNCGGQ